MSMEVVIASVVGILIGTCLGVLVMALILMNKADEGQLDERKRASA